MKTSIDYETGLIAFEIPQKNRKTLYFKEILQETDTKEGLQIPLGKDLNNNTYNIDLCSTPHLLISGTTGSGKSVFINTILLSLINNYKPNDLRLNLIDPKQVELSIYNNIKHVDEVTSSLTGAKKILNSALLEINRRYKSFEKINVRNIINYRKKTGYNMPYIVIVIDELADILLQDKKSKLKDDIKGEMTLENLICRIAQIGRACGVHLIVATQRPSSNIITGLIKANIPSRVAFAVSNKVDSRVILDQKGAEKLTGKGDMLFKMVGDEELHRLQGAYISDEEIENIIEELKPIDKTNISTEIEKNKKVLYEQSRKEMYQEYEKEQAYKKKNQETKNLIFNSLQYGCSIPRNRNIFNNKLYNIMLNWIFCTIKDKKYTIGFLDNIVYNISIL